MPTSPFPSAPSASSLGASAWLHCPRPVPNARLRLYAFPFAGGGASVFFPWSVPLAPDIEVWAVRAPGRETRLREAPITTFPVLLEALMREVAPRLRPPYALFGHSLGALVAYSFAQALQNSVHRPPSALIASGARAPHVPLLETDIGKLPTADFITQLRDRYDGIPPAVLAHPELMELMLPLLRADIQLCEDYRHQPAPPLPCPLAVFGGLADPLVPADGLAAWGEHTRAKFQTRTFAGGHFFLQTQAPAVLAAVREFIAGVR